MTTQQGKGLSRNILLDLKLIEIFATKLSHSDYQKPLAVRKNIYPFIHNLTSFLIELGNKNPEMHKFLNQECQPYWTALYKSLEDCEKLFNIEWGEMEGIPPKKEDPNIKADVVRMHEVSGPDVDKIGIMTS